MHVEFLICWYGDGVSGKIDAIKAIRRATGCGLKLAKVSVETVDDTWGTWRMTVEQFGLFMVEYCQAGDTWAIKCVELVDNTRPVGDFTVTA